MENEMEEIKIKASKNFDSTINMYSKIKIILSFQIINILIIILFFTFIIKEKHFIPNNGIKYYNQINNKLTLSDKLKFLKIITNNDESEYKGIQECLIKDPDQESCIYHLIVPKEVIGKKRILLGDKSDGCYVLLDDFQNIKIAYSFGISVNIQFDKALADKGIDVYMYDHTINSLPYENPKFHWKKIGLCGVGQQHNDMKSLEDLIKDNGHTNQKDMILKMDIEKWEFEAILNLQEETLNKFKYIAIEYHFENRNKDDKLYYNVIKKISKTHQAFYVRCNGQRWIKANFGNNRICYIMEVSYIIKKGHIFKKDETVWPIYEFDYSKVETGKLEMNLNVLKLFVDE